MNTKIHPVNSYLCLMQLLRQFWASHLITLAFYSRLYMSVFNILLCKKCPCGVIEPKTPNCQLVTVALFFNFEVQIFICDLVTTIYFSITFNISKIQPLTYFLRGGPFRPPPSFLVLPKAHPE